MMPFLHDGNPTVTITPTNGNGSADLHKFVKQQENGGSKQFSSEGGKFQHKVVVRNSAPSIAEIQRKAAQRKLQMAKMIGHTSMGPQVDFRKPQGHQTGMMIDYHNDSLQAASRRARSNNFTLNETFALLKIWASPEMQWQMKHNFRNFRVWEAISYAMQELGHDRTAIQCKNRIQNLTSIFYRIKKSKQDYRSFNFPYYKIIGDVLDGKKNGNNASMPPNMAEFMQHFSNSGAVTVSPTHSSTGGGGSGSSGIAAHMALVEEYQHLINGNPEVTLTPAGDRNNSSNGSNGMNVLSPEVSISEGDSPIRMDAQQVIRSATGSGSVLKNHMGSGAGNRNSAMNGTGSGSRLETEDGMGMEDGSAENDHGMSDIDDGSMYAQEEEAVAAMLGRSEYTGRGKRSVFGAFSKMGFGNGMPSKRSRGLSSATTTSNSVGEDPVGQYLSEMVDIERQWLDMERERAENERQMMMYMMQILQALVCPEQEEENEDGTAEDTEQGGDGENEYVENQEHDEDETDITEMLEQQQDAPDVQ